MIWLKCGFKCWALTEAWIAPCSSSMVLSLVEEECGAVATRRPLFDGDVLVDAGAENSLLLLSFKSGVLFKFRLPEKENDGLLSRRLFFFPAKESNGRTILAYLLRTLLTSNFSFLSWVSFSSGAGAGSLSRRHFVSLNIEKGLDFVLRRCWPSPLLFFAVLLELQASSPAFFSGVKSPIGRVKLSRELVEDRGETGR